MYEFFLLDSPTQAQGYETLTYPYYRPLLQKLTADASPVAIGVSNQSEPVGLALAVYEGKDSVTGKVEAQVRSLFIKSAYRRQGLGTALLKRLETELQQRSCSHINLNYTENQSSDALKSLLLGCGWQEPENLAILVYCSAAKVRTAPHPHLIERAEEFRRRLSPDYEIFPWIELRETEREAILEKIKTDEVWQKFNPFRGNDVINPISSMGMRHQGKVIAWVITHQMIADMTTFAQMFVTPECKLRPLIALPLLAEAVKACFNSGCLQAAFRTEMSNKPMLKFIDRWLVPYIETKRRLWTSYRNLVFP